MKDPIRPADDNARTTVRNLLDTARSAALGVLGDDGGPFVTRIAFGLSPEGAPLTLISDLSLHTAALRADPRCSLLIGDPGSRGDPLTHPRLTLTARAAFVANGTPDHDRLAAHYLHRQPKAKLYIGFADFAFVLFTVSAGHLNAGFGRAHRLAPRDMGFAD